MTRDFLRLAVFLCKIPFETALSHNLYKLDNSSFKASEFFSLASLITFLTAVLIEDLKATFLK